MKKKVITLLVFLYSIFSIGQFLYNYVKKDLHSDNKTSIKDSSIYMLNQYGIIKNHRWVHEEDSLAEIQVKFKKLMFLYEGKLEKEKTYNYQIKNDLKKRNFLILTNEIDTLEYEVLTYNDSVMSLRHFSEGKILKYKKKL